MIEEGGGGGRQDDAGEDEGKLLKRGKGVPGNLFSSARHGSRAWEASGGYIIVYVFSVFL